MKDVIKLLCRKERKIVAKYFLKFYHVFHIPTGYLTADLFQYCAHNILE